MSYSNMLPPGLEQTIADPVHSVTVKPADVVVVPNEKLVFSLSQDADKSAGKAKAHLTIHNPTDQAIIFKFKTNAGKANVGVKPCSGRILPGDQVFVDVSLDYGAKQDVEDLKVLVVTAPAPPYECDLKTIWKHLPQESMKIIELKCVVNMPQAQNPPMNAPSAPNPMPGQFQQQYQQAASQAPHGQVQSNIYAGPPRNQAGLMQESPPVPPKPRQYFRSEPNMIDSSTMTANRHDSMPQWSRQYQPQFATQGMMTDPSSMIQAGAAHCLPNMGLGPEVGPNAGLSRRSVPDMGPSVGSSLQQPFSNLKQCITGGEFDTGKVYYPESSGPTSYFVDVSSVANKGNKRHQDTEKSTFMGVDKHTVLQMCLLGIAAIAATKLFSD